MNKNLKSVFAVVLCLVLAMSMVPASAEYAPKQAEYNTTTSVMPSNWNEFTYADNKAWGAPIGKAFGLTVGAPAGIGIVLADTAVKAATIDVLSVATPGNGGTSYSNEVNTFFYGDSGAVKQAIIAARDVGLQLLKTLEPNEELKSSTTPYII